MAKIALDSIPRPPDALRRRLRPGESLVWWSHGGGSFIDLDGIIWGALTFVMIGLFAIVAVVQKLSFTEADLADPRLPLYLAVMLLPLLFAVFRAVWGPGLNVYALTSKRVICIPFGVSLFMCSAVRPRNDSDATDDDLETVWLRIRHPPIKKLRVFGNPLFGNVRLRGAEGSDHSGAAPFLLVGVQRPLELAGLIKSTLKLNLPVDDRTRTPASAGTEETRGS